MGSSDQSGQFAQNVDLRGFAGGRGLDRDRLDQIAQGGLRFAAVLFPFRDRRLEALDRREIAFHRGWVQSDDLGRLLGRRELGPQPIALGLQWRQFALERILLDQPLHIGAIDALVLPLCRRQPLLDLRPIRDGARGEALALLIVDLDIKRDGLAIGHALSQPADDRLLDLVEVIGAPVAAAAGFRRGGAADPDAAMVAILDRHAATAGAATQQPGKQMLRSRPLARAVQCPPVAPRLDRVECLGIDDCEMRNSLLLVLGDFIDARDAPARRRILDHAHPVPDHAAGIERIEQDAVATVAVAVDRHRCPEAAARRRHGLVIQPAGDLARAATCDILGEDPADDLRLFRHDLKLARPARHGPIAIGSPAGAAPFPDHAGEAAADLLRQPLQEQRRHRALEADMHLGDLAVGDGEQLHAGELHRLIEPGDIGKVAREAIEILGQDGVELPGERQPDQALIIRPAMDRGAGSGAIGEDVGDSEAEAIGVRAAERDLILDRAVTLQVGRESCVDRRAHASELSLGRPARSQPHDRGAPPRAQAPRSTGRGRDQV